MGASYSNPPGWADEIIAMATAVCDRDCPWCFAKPWREMANRNVFMRETMRM